VTFAADVPIQSHPIPAKVAGGKLLSVVSERRSLQNWRREADPLSQDGGMLGRGFSKDLSG